MHWELEYATKLPSRANARKHWAPQAKLNKLHRSGARLQLLAAFRRSGSAPQAPVRVHLTRIAPHQLDSDNLAHAFKAIQDGVADAIGLDDGPNGGIIWTYDQAQERVPRVRIEIDDDTPPLPRPRDVDRFAHRGAPRKD